MSMNGIDISNWQAGMSLSAVSGSIGFVIVKATEGIGFVDKSCDKFYQEAKRLGKKLGFYHFARQNDPVAEADFFYENTKNYFGEAIPILDWEVDNDIAWVNKFVERIHALTGVWPWVYANPWRFNKGTVNKNCGRWIAGYPKNGITDINYGKNNAIPSNYSVNGTICAWQFSSSVRLSGYNGNLDGDIFYGDESAWDKYADPKGAASRASRPQSQKRKKSRSRRRTGSTLDLVYHIVTNNINGDARRDYCGSRYDEVQGFINDTHDASASTLAEWIKAGKYGNNPVRKTVIEACGGKYQEAQDIINGKGKGGGSASSGTLDVDGSIGVASTRRWQQVMGTIMDGIISGQYRGSKRRHSAIHTIRYGRGGSNLIRAVQRVCGITQDGLLGPDTIRHIQARLGVAQDGSFGPITARALQRRLNSGRF